jgi:3-keto-disaccharide hydrolase
LASLHFRGIKTIAKTVLAIIFSISTSASIASAQDSKRIELFNGKNFSGWTFCMKNHADPMKTWSVTNGVIHCTGRPTGYLRTKQSYRDYTLTIVWRFVKVTPKANNTGVLVHMQLPDKVWPVCVQVQGKHNRQGDLFLMEGAESKEHRGMDKNTPLPMRGQSAEKPVGEWNTCKVVCSGNDVKAYINGVFENETTECTVSSGFIGIQSEGGDIEIRSVVLEPLKS